MTGSNSEQTPWTAQMITADVDSAPILRTTFEVGPEPVADARLRTTAHGLVEAHLNGRAASADVLTPGWTSYEQRLRFAEWDVTDLLADGANTLVLAVGNGWYKGRLGWLGLEAVYGKERAAAAELVITYSDGHVQTVRTDESWGGAASGILADDLYDGETIDARGLLPESAHLADAGGFGSVRTVDFDPAVLEPYVAPPVRRHEEIAPTLLGRTAAGEILLDFGQNLVGWLRLEVAGEAGHEIVVHHAEVLEDGDLALRPLRSAKAADRFVLSGGQDVFEPTFTFHGFRYARIAGWPGEEDELAASVRAVVVSSQLERTGHFACSDADLNRLHENVVWGMRGNFVGLPTDCPQRDERMAYVGDLGAFAPTATFLYDVEAFLRDWLRDLNVEQRIGNGVVPLTAPNTLKYEPSMFGAMPEGYKPAPMALWQDGAVWIPWAMWEQYGDRRVLEQQATSISDYLTDVEEALDPDGTYTAGYQLGDWLDPAAPPDDPRAARADREVAATACVYHSFDLGARIAEVLGDHDEAARRRSVAERIRNGFAATYVDAEARIRSDAPTVYALAIAFGMLDEDQTRAAGDRLAELVAAGGHVIATGFMGTPFVLHALSSTGHADTAYRLLLQRQCPSWLYQVDMGATTIWERWDAMQPDGTVNPGEMTSFNHYALGSVGDWLHRVVAGLSPLEPGYRRVLFAPQPGGGLSAAEADVRTPRGRAAIRWSVDDTELALHLEVPEGATGVLRLPGGPDRILTAGTHEIKEAIATFSFGSAFSA